MNKKLKKELGDFLLPYSISASTTIFNDYLIKQIGLDIAGKQIQFSHYTEDLNLTIPPLRLTQLDKVLDFFKLPRDQYKTGKTLEIDEALMFNQIVPAFKVYIIEQAKQAPEQLKPYQIDSRSELEETALKNIRTYTEKMKKKLNNPNEEANPLMREFSLLIFQLEGIVGSVKHDRRYASYMNNIRDSLNEFIEKNHQPLYEFLNKEIIEVLLQEITTYITYNFAESALAMRKIFKELNDFLQVRQIDMTSCNILEDMLLNMADVNLKPASCKYGRDYQAIRMVFRFRGLNDTDAEKFLTFLKKSDETAHMNKGGNQISPLSGFEVRSIMVQQCYEIKRNKAVKPAPHNFSIDGEAFYKNILPLFYEKIKNSSAAFLMPYQGAANTKETAIPSDESDKKVKKLISIFNNPPMQDTSTSQSLIQSFQS